MDAFKIPVPELDNHFILATSSHCHLGDISWNSVWSCAFSMPTARNCAIALAGCGPTPISFHHNVSTAWYGNSSTSTNFKSSRLLYLAGDPITEVFTYSLTMFRHSVRRLAIAAAKAAEPSAHTLAVSHAQGISKGLTGGLRALSSLAWHILLIPLFFF